MRSPASLDARCYHAALFLCPPAFRREFAQEILLVFDEARQEARLAAPQYGLWSFRARMAVDLAATIVRQWFRTGLPILAPLAILYPLAASSALATLWRRMPFHMPRGTADSDVLMLELLAAVVLLIVAATIILTLWFTRPLLYRHRR
jgi:hypothetical protein